MGFGKITKQWKQHWVPNELAKEAWPNGVRQMMTKYNENSFAKVYVGDGNVWVKKRYEQVWGMLKTGMALFPHDRLILVLPNYGCSLVIIKLLIY